MQEYVQKSIRTTRPRSPFIVSGWRVEPARDAAEVGRGTVVLEPARRCRRVALGARAPVSSPSSRCAADERSKRSCSDSV